MTPSRIFIASKAYALWLAVIIRGGWQGLPSPWDGGSAQDGASLAAPEMETRAKLDRMPGRAVRVVLTARRELRSFPSRHSISEREELVMLNLSIPEHIEPLRAKVLNFIEREV